MSASIATQPPSPSAWMSLRAAARLAELHTESVRRLAGQGLIRVRRIPGCRIKYLRADVERIAREGIAAEA